MIAYIFSKGKWTHMIVAIDEIKLLKEQIMEEKFTNSALVWDCPFLICEFKKKRQTG